MTRRDFARLILIFALTRAALTIIGALAVTYLPSTEGEQYTHLLDGSAALDMWYRQDAGFYASIATYGFDWFNQRAPADDMAFMPIYPLLVHLVSGLTPTGCALSPYLSTCATIGGVIISNIALLAATLFLFDLVLRRYDKPTAYRAVILLMLSPIGVFLSGVYTEATFLFLTVLTFWLLERDRFWLALMIACLAAITRSVGIALYPALLLYAWRGKDQIMEPQRTSRAQRIKLSSLRIIAAHLPLVIFGGYILFMGLTVGDPLAYFSTYELTWGRAAGTPIQAFTTYFSGEPVSLLGWERSWIDLVMTLGYLVLALLVLREDRAWGLFALLALAIPIASGTLVGMPRFGAVIFPFYILIAKWIGGSGIKARGLQLVAYGASAALALLFLIRFVTWGWIT
jgi:hypothetical protein